MSEVKMPSAIDLPGNSNSVKADEEHQKPKVQKVVKGKVLTKKKTFGRRLADTFIGEDARDVKSYIITDVIVPAIKDIISDVVTGTIDMVLYGGRRGGNTKSHWYGSGPYTAYSSKSGYVTTVSKRAESQQDYSRTCSSRYMVEDIVMESRADAEEVLGEMIDTIKDYGAVSVAELYEMVGIAGVFTDNAWGWFDLGSASVRHIRNGYMLMLPKVQSIK